MNHSAPATPAIPLAVAFLAITLTAAFLAFSCGPRSVGSGGSGAPAATPAFGMVDGDRVGSAVAPVHPPVHPSFRMTHEELQQLVRETPPRVQDRILADPGRFLELLLPVLDREAELLQLVDKRNPISESYEPDDLVPLQRYPRIVPNREGLLLREIAMQDAVAMSDAAQEAGIRLVFSSTFRSREYQKDLYERYVRTHGQEAADRFSARPGTSQHHLGTVVDFGNISDEFADTPAGKWLEGNAWRYGFSLSYPEGFEEVTGYRFESWHYRYLGREATLLEREFFEGIQQYLLEFLHRNRDALERSRVGG